MNQKALNHTKVHNKQGKKYPEEISMRITSTQKPPFGCTESSKKKLIITSLV